MKIHDTLRPKKKFKDLRKDLRSRKKKLSRTILIVQDLPATRRLEEATRPTVGRFTARRDPPHFEGDEYHAHAEIPGGYEVAGQYPAHGGTKTSFRQLFPTMHASLLQKVLGVDPELLECFEWYDDHLTEDVHPVQIKKRKKAG